MQTRHVSVSPSTRDNTSIHVTLADLARLQSFLMATNGSSNGEMPHLKQLRNALERAVVVASNDIPFYVVTLGSRVRLKDLDTGSASDVELVLPGEESAARGKLSVFSPIGSALLGREELAIIAWHSPAGTKRARVERILYQPEVAAGRALCEERVAV